MFAQKMMDLRHKMKVRAIMNFMRAIMTTKKVLLNLRGLVNQRRDLRKQEQSALYVARVLRRKIKRQGETIDIRSQRMISQ